MDTTKPRKPNHRHVPKPTRNTRIKGRKDKRGARKHCQGQDEPVELRFINEEEAALGVCRAMEVAKGFRDAVVERVHEFSYEVFKNRVDAIVRELNI